MSETATPTITIAQAPIEDRVEFLAKQWGLRALAVVTTETAVYKVMDHICPDYNGGMWEFFTTSNGGAFMVPTYKGTKRIAVDGNLFDRDLAAEPAGLVATQMALSALTFKWPDNDRLVDVFYANRGYICERSDFEAIMAALD